MCTNEDHSILSLAESQAHKKSLPEILHTMPDGRVAVTFQAQNQTKPPKLLLLFLLKRTVPRERQGSSAEEVRESREGAAGGSQGSAASWGCQAVVWKSYGRISGIIGSPEPEMLLCVG